MKHENQEYCLRCENKLFYTHPVLVSWFAWVRGNHQDAHISCSWRDELSQNKAFNEGKSKLKWPDSPHNFHDSNGRPCSHALDIFRLDEQGIAQFEKNWCFKIFQESIEAKLPIKNGGGFGNLGDFNHFQIGE